MIYSSDNTPPRRWAFKSYHSLKSKIFPAALALRLNLEFRFFVTFMPYWGYFVTSQFYAVEETGLPGKDHRLTPSHWQPSHNPMPVFEPRQWRETACSQALDHTAIRADPTALEWNVTEGFRRQRNIRDHLFRARCFSPMDLVQEKHRNTSNSC